jgi:uncharacterized protein (TIGR00255 family)
MSTALQSNVIKSMTGFAKAAGSLPSGDFDLEVKSVNSRYLEVSVKGLPRLGGLERELRSIFQKLHCRGRIDVLINRRAAESKREVSLENKNTDALVSAYATMCRRYGASADHLSQFIGSLILRESSASADTAELGDDEINLVRNLCEQVSEVLASARLTEGAALVADIAPRVRKLQTFASVIAEHMSSAPERLRDRLTERLRQLAPEVVLNADRLALEVAMLADRVDVSEELSRLSIHLGQFHVSLEQGAPDGVGRKLDFLTQEIGRELNTIGSKAQDAVVQGVVVDAKAELEKIREQVQNIE